MSSKKQITVDRAELADAVFDAMELYRIRYADELRPCRSIHDVAIVLMIIALVGAIVLLGICIIQAVSLPMQPIA